MLTGLRLKSVGERSRRRETILQLLKHDIHCQQQEAIRYRGRAAQVPGKAFLRDPKSCSRRRSPTELGDDPLENRQSDGDRIHHSSVRFNSAIIPCVSQHWQTWRGARPVIFR